MQIHKLQELWKSKQSDLINCLQDIKNKTNNNTTLNIYKRKQHNNRNTYIKQTTNISDNTHTYTKHITQHNERSSNNRQATKTHTSQHIYYLNHGGNELTCVVNIQITWATDVYTLSIFKQRHFWIVLISKNSRCFRILSFCRSWPFAYVHHQPTIKRKYKEVSIISMARWLFAVSF